VLTSNFNNNELLSCGTRDAICLLLLLLILLLLFCDSSSRYLRSTCCAAYLVYCRSLSLSVSSKIISVRHA
jgi:hypothetical protein